MSAEPVAPTTRIHPKKRSLMAAAEAKLQPAVARAAVVPAARPARVHPKDRAARAHHANPTTPASTQ